MFQKIVIIFHNIMVLLLPFFTNKCSPGEHKKKVLNGSVCDNKIGSNYATLIEFLVLTVMAPHTCCP